ncbi:hypothetical protein DMC30DRAFT_400429 [Rhodotorula diobovata]|uniref:Elongator complex protein 5 n=1 Tax=Rhodotorula diobovata TaxID=5288 RepID=A0A5C5FUH6_9BASI|nr:hypothetical protein DMC30DRAFT_400429 [Rhodotorula diobovata]
MSHSSDFLTFTLPPSPHSSLPSTTSALPPDFSLLLTDTLDAPATFLIVQLVARALRPAQPEPGRRAEKRRRVVVVGVREREDHWAGTLKKHGIQLATESSARRFSFVDASSPSTTLPDLFASLRAALAPSSPQPGEGPSQAPQRDGPADAEQPGPLVVIDDLSALLWIGREPREVVRWWRGVRAFVGERSGSLVTLLHADTLSPSPSLHAPSSASSSPYASPEDQYLFRQVLQACDLWAEIVGLGNGGTGARGELSLHRAPALVPRGWSVDALPRSGSRALQYKLDEGGAVWEVKGQMGGKVW